MQHSALLGQLEELHLTVMGNFAQETKALLYSTGTDSGGHGDSGSKSSSISQVIAAAAERLQSRLHASKEAIYQEHEGKVASFVTTAVAGALRQFDSRVCASLSDFDEDGSAVFYGDEELVSFYADISKEAKTLFDDATAGCSSALPVKVIFGIVCVALVRNKCHKARKVHSPTSPIPRSQGTQSAQITRTLPFQPGRTRRLTDPA